MKFRHQKYFSSTLSLMAMVIFLTGCPYSSSVPIDEGTVKVSPKLAGEWLSSGDTEQENPTYYIISIDDNYHATAKEMQYSSDDTSYTETIFHLTFSDVNGDTFMNAIEEGGAGYSLYKFKYDKDSDEISTSEVTPYIRETFDSSRELKEYIAKNKDNSYFFTDSDENFIRK